MALPERPCLTLGRALALLALGFVVCQAPARAQATGGGKKMQCWIDDRGQRACGDAVPPGEARRQRAVIDSRGVVKKTLPAQKTSAEVEAELKAQQAREQAEAYDRYLVQAYQSVDEIGRARDERIASIDARLRITEKSLADASTTLNELRQQAAKAVPPKPGTGASAGSSTGSSTLASPGSAPSAAPEADELDPKLAQNIESFTASRASQADAVMRLRHERERILSDFARDISRYKELRAPASAADAAAAPAAASAVRPDAPSPAPSAGAAPPGRPSR